MPDWWWGTPEWLAYQRARGGSSDEPLDPVAGPSYVIDLRPELSQLRENLSKGHRAAVQHGLWSHRVVEFTNTAWMRACHERAAGRITRPLSTWECMDHWIRQDNGLCLASYGSDLVRPLCWGFFIRYQDGAYYMSGASEPDLPRSSSAGHVLMWEAIKRLHSWGYNWLETGEGHTPGIDTFKRGFGGRLVNLGERVGDSLYVHAPMAERTLSELAVEAPR